MILNMFREFTLLNVEGYKELPIWQKDMFDATYKKHLSSLSLEEKISYTENHIKKVEGEKSIIKVYFDNDECFFYLPGHQWVKVSNEKTLFNMNLIKNYE